MKMKILLWFLCGIVFSTSMLAQKANVSGTVLDSSGDPIPGVNVIIKGTRNGTIADVNGFYTINANIKSDILTFSFVGMETQEIALKGRVKLDVKLKNESIGLDDVVVIGYGTQKKKEVTGAVARVEADQISKISTSDLGSALQGQVAGVNVQMSSGEPGAASNIQIRGVTSITGSNAPLFVVDGIPQEEDPQLSNNEIESIDILKDAASAAIYGTRGAGGVILITTKQAKAGKLKVSVDGYYGVQNITSGMPMLTTEEWAYAYFNKKEGFGEMEGGLGTDVYTPLQNNQRYLTNNTNVLDQIQNDNAKIQNYSVTFSGGKKNLTNSIVLNYFNQEGVIINSGYDRFNFRTNSVFRTNKLTLKVGVAVSIDDRDRNTSLYTAYRYKPYQDPFDAEASSLIVNGNDTDVETSRALIQQTQTINNTKTGKFSGNIQLNYKLAKGLGAFVRAGGRYSNSLALYMKPNLDIYDNDGVLIPATPSQRSSIKNTDAVGTSIVAEGGISYDKKIGRGHKIKFLGVATTEEYTYTSFYAERLDVAYNEIQVLDGGASEYMTAASGNKDRVNKLIGLLARLQYDYKSRYLLSASVRRDGSSRFAEGNRFGTFPSVSAGWNISSEPFWTSFKDVANSLKVRLSYGTTGNQNFADYSYSATITSENDYVLGAEGSGILQTGATQEGFVNPDVKWETSSQANLGIDLGMFKNRLTFSADFYNTQKTDMLFPLLLPASTGVADGGTVVLNIGDMENKGMEFSLGYRTGKTFKWGVNYTFTKNINEVTKMSGGSDSYPFADSQGITGVQGNEDKITYLREGYEAGAFFLMETDGVVNTDEKLAIMKEYVPDARMGDLFYIDQNGDKELNELDKVYKGSGMPEFEMGLNLNCSYKGLDLSMQWYGSFGNEVYNASKCYAYTQGTHKDLLYSWSVDNPDTDIPIVKTGNTAQLNARAWADVWVEDGSFVRLRNIIVGYSLPKSVLNKISLSKIRVYLASDNPITITKYSGFDPEVGSNGLSKRGLDQGRYPISSQYRVGVQLGF